LFNRKKRKDPGLYGKYEKIDISPVETPEPEPIPTVKVNEPEPHQQREREHADYTDDEDLASLEQLIQRIKKKAKQGARPEPGSDDLEELKQQESPFEEGQDEQASSAGSLLSSSSFIQGLESDLLGKEDASTTTIQKQVEKTLERLLDDILRLSASQRQQIVTSDVFRSFLSLLDEEKDVTDE
jgi:long-subunit acyl-CoA synthetase (AMP-forming)